MAAALLVGTSVQGQVADYTFNQSVGTYTDITGGLSLTTTTTTTVAYVDGTANFTSGASNGSNNFIKAGVGYPIGFDFTYNNDVFDRIGIAPQGWISLGKSSNGATAVYAYGGFGTTRPLNYAMPAGASPAADRFNRIAAAAISNLIPRNAAPLGELRVETIGTAPNRVCVVQWANFRTGSNPDALNFQIRLNENGNTVEVVFKDPDAEWLNSGQFLGAQVGLRGATGSATGVASITDFNRVSTGSTAPYSWTSLTWPVVANDNAVASTCYIDGNPANVTKPAAGTTLRWTPPTCARPQNVQLATIGANSVTLSWNADPGATFEYAINTVNSPTTGTPITGSGISGTSVVAAGLSSNTVYYAFVRKDCGVDGFSSWAAAPSTSVTVSSAMVPNAFRTAAACAEAFDRSYDFIGGFVESISTICPSSAGQVAEVTFTAFDMQSNNTALYVYNGPTTASPLISSGQPALAAPANIAGGFYGTANPGPFSTAVDGCLTFRFVSQFGGGSWNAQVACVVPSSCPLPADVSVTPAPNGGQISWTGAAPEFEYKVVAGGDPASGTALATGIVASSPVVVNTLVGGTPYTVFVRGVCVDDSEVSAWTSPVNFTTLAGCGGPLNLFRSTSSFSLPALNSLNGDSVVTVCPNNVGEIVTVAFSQLAFSTQAANNSLYVYNGPNTSAPQFQSGLNNLAITMPPGGFHGSAISAAPPTFTSTHPSGCLTFRVRAFGAGSFDTGALGAVTCAPVAACATPDAVTVSSSQNSAVVSWSGAGSSIIEYGPVGFTPGTGASAGVNGTVVSGVSSPYTLTGLAASTTYDVYVRQLCAGPAYSANTWRVRFGTSLDCSTAQVITCGELVNNVFNSESGDASYVGANYVNASCMGSTIGQAGGLERLYRISLPLGGAHQFNIPANTITATAAYAIAPVSAGCAPGVFTCIGTATNTGAQLPATLAAGDYYVIVESSGFVSGSQGFQVYCPGPPPCVTAPTFPANNTTLALNTTPIAFSWPAAFGATGYDIYFDNALVVSNHPTNSITSGSYTPQSVAGVFGIGNPVTWRVEPRNADGVTSCSNWTFRVGGNGAANAIPITAGQTIGGANRATNGYTNLSTITGMNAPDVTFSFTATACANGITAVLCPRNHITQTYAALYVVRASDNTLVGAFSGGSQTPPNCITLNLAPGSIEAGQNYFIVVDSYFGQFDFTLTYTENLDVATDSDNDGTPDCLDECPFDPNKTEEGICGCFVADTDTDGDGTPDCIDSCPSLVGGIGDPCPANILYLNAEINASCECEGVDLAPCTNQVTLEVNTDVNGEETTWELLHTGGVILSGGGVGYPSNGTVTEFFCLPDACYTLRVYDAGGDGIAGGGYTLRMSGMNGDRIIDNVGNFGSGTVSAIGSGASAFCFPMGTNKPVFQHQDKEDFVSNAYFIAEEDAAVSAQWQVGNQTDDGYEFWLFDPNGSYSYRRFRNHATSDGFANVGATRACHMRVNGWFASQHAPANVLLNVRIRTRVNGVNGPFGPAFRFRIDPARAACPLTKLNDFPGNQYESCNKSRNWGSGNWIHARPVPSANRYQWRFRNGDGFDRTVTTNTYFLQLNWASQPLVPGSTYNVEVRASKNGGASYCTNAQGSLPELEVWGDICTLTINSSNAQGGGEQLGLEGNANKVTMYPNPNRGDQLWLNIDVIEEGVEMITVDFFDLAGHRAVARMIPTQGDRLQTVLDFQGQLAAGVYIVHITAGEKVYTERLVITQ